MGNVQSEINASNKGLHEDYKSESSDEEQEVIVNQNDERKEAYKFKLKNENIKHCIGKLVTTFTDGNNPLKTMHSTATVFEVYNGYAYAITCAHGLRLAVYQCSKCKQEKYKRNCNTCKTKKHINKKTIIKAGTICFQRRNIENGEVEKIYYCRSNVDIFLKDTQYCKYPFPSGGYDIAVVKFKDDDDYYSAKCRHIKLIDAEVFSDMTKQKKLAYYVFGYGKFKDDDGKILVGDQSSKHSFELEHKTYSAACLKQTEIDTSDGSSGAAMFSIIERSNDTYHALIFGIHSGGKDKEYNVATPLLQHIYHLKPSCTNPKRIKTINHLILNVEQEKPKNIIFLKPEYLDPLTSKVMTDPVQLVKSGTIYDAITVKHFQNAENFQTNYLDPTTGMLISDGKSKPPVIHRKDIQREINDFKDRHNIDNSLINGIKDLNDSGLWKRVRKNLSDKYDIKKQQEKVYRKASRFFYTQTSSDASLETKEEVKCENDHIFVAHSQIPIIALTGPSRIGKSFLLNSILQNQPTCIWEDKEMDVFDVSANPDTPETKGSWISMYGDIDNGPYCVNEQADDMLLLDNSTEDDLKTWHTDLIIIWLKSLNVEFDKKYPKLIDFVEQNKMTWTGLAKLNEKILTNLGMGEATAKSLVNILKKRSECLMDSIDNGKDSQLQQMYFLDTEGLSHQRTCSTVKVFQRCYAVSNVILWYDSQVNSDEFKELFAQLEKDMKIIANSSRKPAFMYIKRNDEFDYEVDDVKTDFDGYIKRHKSFENFRNLNLFSSIHGYSLDFREKKHGKRKYGSDTLDQLTDKIKQIANKTVRFVNGTKTLEDQLSHLNKHTTLSIEKLIALNSIKSQIFVLNQADEDIQELQIHNAAITFNYDEQVATKAYNEARQYLVQRLKKQDLSIGDAFSEELEENKNKIVKKIRKKNKLEKKVKKIQAGMIGVGALYATGFALSVATHGLAPAVWVIFGNPILIPSFSVLGQSKLQAKEQLKEEYYEVDYEQDALNFVD